MIQKPTITFLLEKIAHFTQFIKFSQGKELTVQHYNTPLLEIIKIIDDYCLPNLKNVNEVEQYKNIKSAKDILSSLIYRQNIIIQMETTIIELSRVYRIISCFK